MQPPNINNLEIEKIDEYTFVVKPFGQMRVPLKIFATKEMIEKMKEDICIVQGLNVATLPGIYKQSIMMPDAHQGYGFPIGEVAAFDFENGVISPGGIGYDINCGVRLMSSSLTRGQVEPKIHELLNRLFDYIPCGVGGKSTIRLNETELDEVLNTGLNWMVKKGFATKEDQEKCEEYGSMKEADASKISKHAKERGKSQLGTLGAGNHFAEVQIVDEIYLPDIAKRLGMHEKNQICFMVHCGSRGLGHQICTDYLRKAEINYHAIVEGLPDRELAYFPAGSQDAADYLSAMCAAANFAWSNRQLITFNSRKAFQEIFGEKTDLPLIYDVAHNMAKVEEYEIEGVKRKVYVHRKGATRAFGPGHKELPEIYKEIGQPILIPGSMGTASYVLIGTDKAMQETFGSTAHGAGRMMSRHKANQLYRGEKVKNELEYEHIYIKSASWKGISEESPGAYKNVDEIADISDKIGIGKKVVRLRPLGVIKG